MLPVLGALLFACLCPFSWAEEALTVRYVDVPDEELPLGDPTSALWAGLPAYKATLLPQNLTYPVLETPSVASVEVKAMHNSFWVAFLLEWPDPTKDANVDVDRFTDAVAIQFPVNPEELPFYTMGNVGARVHIIHWKALWQKDIEEGFQDVQDLHPNYWVDLYFFAEAGLPVFAEGEFPQHPAARSFRSPEALAQLPGAYVQNPMSVLERKVPVEEAMAEGFGTLTSQPKQNAVGRGVWQEGRWRVVIARPMVTDDELDAELSPGLDSLVAFAVWNGSEKNVGARKHYAIWIKLHLERKE